MNQLFDANLQLLEQYDSPLAEKLRTYQPQGRAEYIETPSGKPSIRITHQDKAHLLHSTRDPEREAKRWVDTLENPPMYNIMVLGCGMMHHAVELVKRYQGKLKSMYVIERDMDVLHLAFQTVNLVPFLRTKTVYFLAEPGKTEIRLLMNEHLTSMVMNGIEVVEHPASVEIDPEYYQTVKKEIDDSLQSGEVILRTKVQVGGMIQENIIRNVPLILSNPSVSALQSLLQNIPAFVVCAGPSLDKNVEQLKEVKDQGIIIAVDTVFKKLVDLGIQPHIVVTTDPTELNTKHFDGLTELGETVLAFPPSVYHSIPRQMDGTKITMPLPASKFLNAFKSVLGEPTYLPTGTNVGQTAFNLARFLGCSPIVLTGLDLSFSATGGNTHTSGTAYKRKIEQSAQSNRMRVELISDQPEWEEFAPILIPGNDGNQVATSKFWFGYLRSFEEEIKKTEAPVINCTEGGALIEGTKVQPLLQTIQEVCTKDCMINSTLQMSVGFFFGVDQNEGKGVLQEAVKILNHSLERATEGINQIAATKTIVQSQSPNPNLIREQLDRLHDLHIALVQDHKIYSVLDEAADAVLYPFLQYDNRPETEEITSQNVERAIKRYERYFLGMKELCEQFKLVAEETVATMDESDSSLTTW